MNNLDIYVEKVKNWIDKTPNVTENLIVKHVYLELGNKFSFDENYRPASDSYERKKLYKDSSTFLALNKCMETNRIICNSLAHIITYILRELGIDAKTAKNPHDPHPDTPHVFNVITPRNGEPYIIDLQNDLYIIQMHGFTKNFGISTKNINEYTISRQENEAMDRMLGYITDNNYYSDGYIDVLKENIKHFGSFQEQARYVLENIEEYKNPNMSYADKQWYHVDVLERLFDNDLFDYERTTGKILFANCYKKINGIKKYICVVIVESDENIYPDIYIYNKRDGRYYKIDFANFNNAIENGLTILCRTEFSILKKAFRQYKKEKHIIKN